MKTQIPLHRIEWARRRLDHLFDVGGCCLLDIDPSHHHEDVDLLSDDPDYRTLRDLLDELIEEARP